MVPLHAEQAEPLAPQCVVVDVWQVFPEQQPSQVEVQPLQAPSTHASPSGHESQALPALPHERTEVPARQVDPEQQPAQEDTVHMQLP